MSGAVPGVPPKVSPYRSQDESQTRWYVTPGGQVAVEVHQPSNGINGYIITSRSESVAMAHLILSVRDSYSAEHAKCCPCAKPEEPGQPPAEPSAGLQSGT